MRQTGTAENGTRGRRGWVAFALVSAAVLLNLAPVQVFYSVEILFGSVATLLVAVLFGPLAGVATAVLASLHTWVLWEHPWAIVIFAAEAGAVGLLWRRRRGSLALLDAAYWAVLGLPLVFLFYDLVLGLDGRATLLVALKQAGNGVFDALVASLIITHVPLRRWVGERGPSRPGLQRVLFDLFLATALLPALTATVLAGRRTVTDVDTRMHEDLVAASETIGRDLTDWRTAHVDALQAVAHSIPRDASQASLQDKVELVHAMWPELRDVYVADASARTVAFVPQVNVRGEPTIGLDFSDRPYYRKMRETLAPVVSSVMMSRGSFFEPTVVVGAPIVHDSGFDGYVIGAVELDEIKKRLVDSLRDTDIRATVLDDDGRVIASTAPGRAALSTFDPDAHGRRQPLGDGVYRWRPATERTSRLSSWEQAVLGREHPVGLHAPWRLVVEKPLGPEQQALYARNIQTFAMMLALVALGVVLSSGFTRWLASPLVHLTEVSTDLPSRLLAEDEVRWPKGRVLEVETLVANYQTMLEALRAHFGALSRGRTELEARTRQLARLNDELEAANRSKDDFLALLSHELRTPLTPVAAGLVVLRTRIARGDPIDDVLATMDRQIGHLVRLIDDLLDVSRITRDRIRLHLETVPVSRVVTEATESVRPAAREAGHTLEVEGDGAGLWVRGDPTRLVQIVSNLLNNAVRYTDDGGRIRLTTTVEGEEVVLRVRDTGIGLAPEDLEGIFEPFKQAAPEDRPSAGLGLGLTLVGRLTALHGGSVEAHSDGPGTGSEFVVRLPRTEAPAEVPAPAPPRTLSGSSRVLVVDDSPDIADTLAELVESYGHEVRVAYEGAQALARAREEPPDLVLLDIGLPGMNGYQVARALREILGTGPRLVALTGYGQAEDRQRAKEAGFDLHLTKPPRPETLEALLAGAPAA